jgi:hypothetical protein
MPIFLTLSLASDLILLSRGKGFGRRFSAVAQYDQAVSQLVAGQSDENISASWLSSSPYPAYASQAIHNCKVRLKLSCRGRISASKADCAISTRIKL